MNVYEASVYEGRATLSTFEMKVSLPQTNLYSNTF